jgi:predicted dehydrogenase
VIDAARRSGGLVAVGFNRRFAPLARELRRHLQRIAGPKTIAYRVNAGALPPDHWLRDPTEGGGRLRGEAVHFFDLVRWLVGARPVAVSATALAHAADGLDPDNASVQLQFDDGSQATVLYVSQGATELGKERIECFAGGESFVLEDFRSLQIYGPSAATRDLKTIQKGHAELLAHVHAAVRGNTPLEVSAEDGYWATWCAERALASIGDRSRT